MTCGEQILDIMIQNQQIIRLGDQSEEEADPMSDLNPPSSQNANNQNAVQPVAKQQDHSIFHAIERYLEEHCCIKFLLYLIIILLVIALFQEKEYLIKKQRTFRFFIEKIQKEKIKKELISETQDKTGQNITPPQQPNQIYQSNQPKSEETKLDSIKIQSQAKEDKNGSINPLLHAAKLQKDKELDEKYSSIQGITMSKIIQAARWQNLKNEDLLMHSQLSNEEYFYYEQKYKISRYTELPFCVVVPTFNNSANSRHINNIKSIIMQNYQNYHIVVIDDASTDHSGEEILNYLQAQSKAKAVNFTFTNNSQNHGSLHNIRTAALENCKSNDILMIVDGDDELIGRQVLKLFNAVYQESGAWIVYSNFFTAEGKLGYSKPIPDRVMEANEYRKYPFVTSHLRTLYTQLLREIKEEDLLDKEGKYFTAAGDVAFMLPCLEMAHRRVLYIPELTYMYNDKTGLNVHQRKMLQQRRNDRYLRQRTAYSKREQLLDKNETMNVNGRDELIADPKVEWFAQALRIKNMTKDIGHIADFNTNKRL